LEKANKPYLDDPYVKEWLKGLSQRTRENYLPDFASWVEFIEMTPTEQIEKRLRDTASTNVADRLFFEHKFIEYREHLEKRGNLKAIAIKTMLTAIASFFSRNGLKLNLKRGSWNPNVEQEVKTGRSKLTKEDIKAMYTHGNTRDRALLLVLAQSGFSEADVSCMKIEQLKDVYTYPEAEHYFIEKPREKTHEIQATCFSYEALHDIRAWLQERDNPTEGYLFISTTKNVGEALDTRSIANAMNALAAKAFGKDSEKAKEFKTKMLRSFYNSCLLRANIQPQELKDLLMGHRRQGARKKYSYDDITVKEAYAKAFEFMTINGLQTRTDIAKLKEDMIKQKADFYDQLKAQKADFEKKLNDFHKFVEKNLDPMLHIVSKIGETEDGRRRVQQAVADLQDEQYEKDRMAEEREGPPPEAVKTAEESEKRLKKSREAEKEQPA
jgi:integrase